MRKKVVNFILICVVCITGYMFLSSVLDYINFKKQEQKQPANLTPADLQHIDEMREKIFNAEPGTLLIIGKAFNHKDKDVPVIILNSNKDSILLKHQSMKVRVDYKPNDTNFLLSIIDVFPLGDPARCEWLEKFAWEQ